MKKYGKQNLKKCRKRKHAWKKFCVFAALLAMMILMGTEHQAYAAPTPTPIPTPTTAPVEVPDLSNFQPLLILKAIVTLVMAYVTYMGVMQVVRGVQDWSTAMQQNDTTGTNAALRGIVGGAIQAFVSVLIGIFGIVI